MTRFVPLFLLLALALPATRPARAGIVAPNATVPTHINLVGYGPAGPDSANGHFTVKVLDIGYNPIAGAQVDIEFLSCPDLFVATDQLDPRLSVGCANRTVSAFTSADGKVAFTIVGGSHAGTGTPGPCRARIYSDGVLIGIVPAAAFDLSGAGGVRLSDLSLFSADYFANTHPGRSDYNGDGVVSLLDLSLWAATFFAGGSSSSPATSCP